ncbi:MAG: sugar transferase [Bacteroidota bacterium]|nr:sugar transferase [Bacteroidota bacterium]
MYITIFKRVEDLLVFFLCLPVFLIVCIILGGLIKLEDGGPVFYKADRIGRQYKIFKMYKFRSMKVNAPQLINSDGSTYNSKNDPRVTRIGKFIRETSLDELPQLINVLKGDMSIIGPRPSLSSAIGSFRNDESDKMKALPGITGYTQAYFRNSLTNREKRLNDAYYANNMSFCLDARIFIKTIQTVVSRKGIYTNSVIFYGLMLIE